MEVGHMTLGVRHKQLEVTRWLFKVLGVMSIVVKIHVEFKFRLHVFQRTVYIIILLGSIKFLCSHSQF